MFVDASALTAMMTSESDARALLAPLQGSATRLTSPLAVGETSVAVARILALPPTTARDAVEAFLALTRIVVIAVAPETTRLAIDAHDRFGGSRHAAALNFGDCLSYACARHAHQPLLCEGCDFPQTDIATA